MSLHITNFVYWNIFQNNSCPGSLAYYENVQAAMTEVLIYGIFNPYSTRTYRENCKLCHKVRNEKTYKRAIKHNGITGIMPRRVLLFFLNIECYPAVNLICKLSYRVLRRLKR